MVQYVRSTRFSVEGILEWPNAHSCRLLSRSASCELVNVKILNGAMRTKPVSAPSLTRLHSNSLDLSLQQLNNTPVHFNNCVNLTHKGPKDMTLFQDVNLHRPKNQLRKVRKLKIILLICLILRKIWKRNNTRAFNHTKVSYYLSLWRIQGRGPGGPPLSPLFLDQTQTGPPPYLRVWMTAPPPSTNLKVWIRQCQWQVPPDTVSSQVHMEFNLKFEKKYFFLFFFFVSRCHFGMTTLYDLVWLLICCGLISFLIQILFS